MLGLPRGQLVPEPWGCPNAFAVRHLSVPLAASVKALPDYLWASEQSQAGPGPLCLCQERFSNPFRWGGGSSAPWPLQLRQASIRSRD